MKRIASLISGSAAALLVAGLAVFAPGTAAADPYSNVIGGNAGTGTVETATGGVALPGGGGSVAAGGLFRARLTAGANESITITVNLPGTAAPGISVAGSASTTTTTNADGNAFFNVRVPRATPAGTASVVGTNAAGAVIFFSEFQVGGRVAHPAAG
jgi:hypothetical protein